jgi:hypothetical protein
MEWYDLSHPVVITDGNIKLGKIPNVSLPPIVSCQPGIPCAKTGAWYALKYQGRFSVQRARRHNWNKYKKRINAYFSDINRYLDRTQRKYFRWHPDGDIPSENYFDRMVETANDFPGINFLAFTKNYRLDITKCPDNLSLVFSAWPGLDIPDKISKERFAWVKEIDSRIPRKHFECLKHCDSCYKCWDLRGINKDVVFSKH